MPDQSSAATEHAIIQEITRPLERLPEDPLEMVNAEFPTALRGYDRVAVDDYVRHTRQLVAELQATRSPEAAVRRALERVGEQIGGILKRAHETAEQITAQSRREAEDRLEQARQEAHQIIQAAEQRVHDLDSDTDRIWIERQRIVADAEDLAAQLQAVARTAAERFPEDAEAADPVAAESAGVIGPDAELAAPGLIDPEFAAPEFAAPAPESGEPEVDEDDAEPITPELEELDEPLAPFDGDITAETAQHPMPGEDDAPPADAYEPIEADERPPRSEVEQTMAFRPLNETHGATGQGDPEQPPAPARDEPQDDPDGDPDATQIIPPSSQAANRRHDR